MTTILITPSAIPVSLTAEQVVAYLLRPGSGWKEAPQGPNFRTFDRGLATAYVPTRETFQDFAPLLAECILDIAHAERRHALDVAMDIAGPAVGVGGVGCERPLTADEWWAGQMRPLCRQTETCNRVAPRAPEVE